MDYSRPATPPADMRTPSQRLQFNTTAHAHATPSGYSQQQQQQQGSYAQRMPSGVPQQQQQQHQYLYADPLSAAIGDGRRMSLQHEQQPNAVPAPDAFLSVPQQVPQQQQYHGHQQQQQMSRNPSVRFVDAPQQQQPAITVTNYSQHSTPAVGPQGSGLHQHQQHFAATPSGVNASVGAEGSPSASMLFRRVNSVHSVHHQRHGSPTSATGGLPSNRSQSHSEGGSGGNILPPSHYQQQQQQQLYPSEGQQQQYASASRVASIKSNAASVAAAQAAMSHRPEGHYQQQQQQYAVVGHTASNANAALRQAPSSTNNGGGINAAYGAGANGAPNHHGSGDAHRGPGDDGGAANAAAIATAVSAAEAVARSKSVAGAARAVAPLSQAPSHIQLQHHNNAFHPTASTLSAQHQNGISATTSQKLMRLQMARTRSGVSAANSAAAAGSAKALSASPSPAAADNRHYYHDAHMQPSPSAMGTERGSHHHQYQHQNHMANGAVSPSTAPSASAGGGAGSNSNPSQSTGAAGSNSSASAATVRTRLVATHKVKAIDFLRRALLPLSRRGELTREDMVVVCSTVCTAYVAECGHSEAFLEATDAAPLARADEALLTTLLLSTLKDLSAIKAGGLQTGAAATTTPSGINNSTALSNTTHNNRADAGAQTSRAGSLLHRSGASEASEGHREYYMRSDGVVERVPSPQRGQHHHHHHHHDNHHHQQQQQQLAVSGPPPLFESVSYTISGAFPRGVSNSAYIGGGGGGGLRRGGGGGGGRAGANNGGALVPYGGPNNSSINQPMMLRVSLTCPTVQDTEMDTVVIGTVASPSPVALTWWLGYGPQRTVLNLDKLYGSGRAATYQISETSFILSLRAGALVAGWDYSVYLSAATADGTAASAATSFVIPSLSGDDYLRGPPLGNDGGGPLALAASAAANPFTARTRNGYFADEDVGADEGSARAARFGRPPGYGGGGGSEHHSLSGGGYPPRGDGGGAFDDDSHGYDLFYGSATAAPRYADAVYGKPRDAMGGTSLYYDQRDYSTNAARREAQAAAEREQRREAMRLMRGGSAFDDADLGAAGGGGRKPSASALALGSGAAGVRGQVDPHFVPPIAPMAATYQEQLRYFFIEHIEPLYYLSPNPAMPEEAFKAIVKDTARRYWFAYEKDQPLTDALRREIVEAIKTRIAHSMLLTPQQRQALYDAEAARAAEEAAQLQRAEDEVAAERYAAAVAGGANNNSNSSPHHHQRRGMNTSLQQQPLLQPSAYFGITGASE